jgi:hypothetical protein
MTWRKSTFSGDQGDCVEVADLTDGAAVRNSNHPDSGILALSDGAMAAFVSACRAGEFDDLTV